MRYIRKSRDRYTALPLAEFWWRNTVGCVIVEYDLFNTTTFTQNLAYARFGIILTQFYVNFSRREHKIDVL